MDVDGRAKPLAARYSLFEQADLVERLLHSSRRTAVAAFIGERL